MQSLRKQLIEHCQDGLGYYSKAINETDFQFAES
jgi:hypothetical protein